MEEVSNVTNAESTSAEPSVDRAKDTGTAVNLMAQGKRNMICGEIPLAVNQFQDACQLLSKHYGEMAKECAEAYFCYGQALLDLARMETGVLGNALQGVDVEEEEAAEGKETEDEQFENANKLAGDEREKLRGEVYDAMADDSKNKDGDSLKEKTEDMDESMNDQKISKQNLDGKQGNDSEKDTESKVEEAIEEEGSELKPSNSTADTDNASAITDNTELSAKDKQDHVDAENEKESVAENIKDQTEDKKDISEEKKDLHSEENDLPTEKNENKDISSDDKKDVPSDNKDVSSDDKKDTCEDNKKDVSDDKKEASSNNKKDVTSEDKKDPGDVHTKENISCDKKDNATGDSSLPLKNEDQTSEILIDDDKKENTKDTVKDDNLKTETADVEMTADEDEKNTEKTEEDEEEGEEEGEEEEEEEDGDEKTDEDDPEDVSNLQLAWEMLELAKMIYMKESTKESQLRAAQSHLKLGEVGLETEQYEQAISDFKDCLKLQEKHLEPEDRLLAESHYQLGLAYSFIKQYEESIQHFIAAVKTIESKIAKLEETIENSSDEKKKDGEFDDPITRAKQEINDLKEILPDIRAKIEDTEEEQKSLDQLKEITKEALGGKILEGDSTGFGSTSSTSNPEKASDISHLIRKKRKPEEDPEPDSDAKKSRQEIGNCGDALAVNNSENLESKEKQPTTEEAMATS